MVGYRFTELDTVVVTFYNPDNTFSTIVKSDVLTNHLTYNNNNVPVWSNPATTSTDTTSDSLAYTTANQLLQETYALHGYDFTVTVKSSGDVYKFSKLSYDGSNYEKLLCPNATVPRGTAPPSSNCARYLVSYELNGNKITVRNHDIKGFVYCVK
jgi:hypothetical protein